MYISILANIGISKFHNAFYKAIENRKRNPPGEDEEKLFIDVLMSSGASDEVVRHDWITYCIGGFHTSGLRKCFRTIKFFYSWHIIGKLWHLKIRPCSFDTDAL